MKLRSADPAPVVAVRLESGRSLTAQGSTRSLHTRLLSSTFTNVACERRRVIGSCPWVARRREVEYDQVRRGCPAGPRKRERPGLSRAPAVRARRLVLPASCAPIGVLPDPISLSWRGSLPRAVGCQAGWRRTSRCRLGSCRNHSGAARRCARRSRSAYERRWRRARARRVRHRTDPRRHIRPFRAARSSP